MRNVPLLPDEELLLPEELLLRSELDLLRGAAEVPVLSSGFRTRVLNAAIETQARQSYGRRALWAAGLLFASLGLMAWHGPLSMVRDDVADAGESARRVMDVLEKPRARCAGVSKRYGEGEALQLAAGDDWRLAEAEIQSRREVLRHVRM